MISAPAACIVELLCFNRSFGALFYWKTLRFIRYKRILRTPFFEIFFKEVLINQILKRIVLSRV